MGLAYRPEIDGLRAVAVLAVVMCHAGLGTAAGFVGVDVFFVISGYLITSLLFREVATSGRIDLAAFYARRVRRILPVALLVILVVLAASIALPLPVSSRVAIAESGAASAAFVSNVYFHFTTTGYFAGDAAQMPLLHMWSLSVEEQFYLAWPLILILIIRSGVPLTAAISCIAIGSFVVAEFLMHGQPAAAFYQTPARLWELAVGAIIAARSARPAHPAILPAGACVVLLACAVKMPIFPAHGALPAVAGAAMILLALHGGARSAILASRPLVSIGVLSYSIYLWHWPLLAFDRLLRVEPTPIGVRIALVGGSFLLAWFSHRYVESPLRKPWPRVRSGLTTVGIGSCCALLVLSLGLATRPEGQIERYSQYPKHCHPYTPGQPVQMQPPRCLKDEPKVLIWGDSFAHAWTPLAIAIAEKSRMPVATWARDGCPPLPGAKLELLSPTEARNCELWNQNAIAYIRQNGADTLILSARWQNFLGGDGGRSSEAALRDVIASASPHVRRILVIAPTPELAESPEKCVALGSDCSVTLAQFMAQAAVARKHTFATAGGNVTVVDPSEWLCSSSVCPGIRDGNALYADTAHVSAYTAATFGSKVASSWK